MTEKSVRSSFCERFVHALNTTKHTPFQGHCLPDLAALWNGKICLVKEVSDEYHDSVVFWIESGSLHEPMYGQEPFAEQNRMDELLPKGTTNGKMVLSLFRELRLDKSKRKEALQRYDYFWKHLHLVMGGFFGGHRIAIFDFYDFFGRRTRNGLKTTTLF
jgi:hypothetical protein